MTKKEELFYKAKKCCVNSPCVYCDYYLHSSCIFRLKGSEYHVPVYNISYLKFKKDFEYDKKDLKKCITRKKLSKL